MNRARHVEICIPNSDAVPIFLGIRGWARAGETGAKLKFPNAHHPSLTKVNK